MNEADRVDEDAALGSLDASKLPPADLAMLLTVLNHIPGHASAVGPDNRYVYVNREFLEFSGLRADQVIGQHISRVQGEDFFRTFEPIVRKLWRGEAVRWEGWVEHRNHGQRYVMAHMAPYAPDSGEVQLVFSFSVELTEMKLREELAMKRAQLNISEALKTAIVDHALAALVSTDALGHIVEFNPAAETMFGRTRADVLGHTVSEIMIPERFRAAHEAGMLRMQAGGAARIMGKRLEMHALHADGSEFPMEMVLWRTDVDGGVFYTASIADLSQRHAAAAQIERQREALRQSEKLGAMGGLLAGVAHELNNPLAIVMGRASLLEEKCADHLELKADAQRIREAAERCGRIVRTFLNMARNRPSQRGPVALNDMVRAAADMLHYGYRTQGIEMALALADDLPLVTADADQIGQVVMNLLVNAQQALAGAHSKRLVQVQTGLEQRRTDGEPRVWLRVADNGPGVPAALLPRVFEPFFTTKPEGIGTGLGLAMSRTLARDHGGDLVLEPAEPDGGASFRLSLPISGTAGADLVPALSTEPEAAPQTRVLVVDDEPELTALMRDMLEGAGYDVASAESGAVALALLDTAHFDAIVCDLRMPDMDGACLWNEVTTRHPRLARRLLFVTGDTLSPGASEFLRSSHCPALDKPFSKADLLERVAALTG